MMVTAATIRVLFPMTRVSTRAVRNIALRSGVAVLALTLLGALVTVALRERRTALADLAVFGGYRAVEPRLSIDVPYAKFRMVRAAERRDMLRSNPRLFAAAVAAMPRNEGLVQLLFRDNEPAIKSLTSPIDLAAAHYMCGLESGSLNDFGRALQALSAAPDSAAARFNRALLLEQLADLEAAAEAWRRYLALDASSEWADEARQHLEIDSRPSVPRRWLADKPGLIDAAKAGVMPRVRELVIRYPLASRHLVELELLPAWGRGDPHALAAARAIALILSERGNRLLNDAIAEIDRAAPERRAVLAKAYQAYAEGNQALENRDNDGVLRIDGDALKLFSEFPAFGALIVDDVASARYRKYDYAGAQALIDEARTKVDRGYVAFLARLDWLAGLIQFMRGDASESLHSYERSRAAYQKLGETEYQAAQEVNIASALAYLGESNGAAIHLRKALLLGDASEDPRRLYGILTTAADTAIDDGAPAAALVFQDRFVRLARDTGEPLRIAHALVSRSSIFSRGGRRAEALGDIAEVNRLAQQITDTPSRMRLQAETKIAEAFARRDLDDRAVIHDLTQAIDLLRSLDVPMKLAQLLLERGRAHLRLGEMQAAEEDFRSGIDDLELRRRMVKDSELRVAYLDRADRLFVDLAILLLRRGDAGQVFDLLERLRSRELLDRSAGQPMTPMTAAEVRTQLPRNTVLVTHTFAEKTLITCVLDRDGVRAFEQSATAGAARAPMSPPALRQLGALLVDKVAAPSGNRLVFVPDPLLYDVPFAALRLADGHYVIEEHTIVVAPSATVYVRSCDRDKLLRARGKPSLLAVASPQPPQGFDGLPALTRAADEVRQAAANYPHSSTVIASDEQTLPLLSMAGGYDVIHFASHSVIDRRTPSRSALLIGSRGRITAADIETADLSHVRLVILGGCNTGVGKSHRSEGAMSLARSFMVASVPTVIGTVTPVDDAAAERLLTEFHRAYSGGLDAAAALRRAQLKVLYSGIAPDADPASWSAFEVIGGAYAPEREREEMARAWRSN